MVNTAYPSSFLLNLILSDREISSLLSVILPYSETGINTVAVLPTGTY